MIFDGAELAEKGNFEDNRFEDILKEFDENVIERHEVSEKSKTRWEDNEKEPINANITKITFDCPNQIAEEIGLLYLEYKELFGMDIYPKDIFISTLLLKGIREYKKENLK